MTSVFISYSHKNKEHLDRLLVHLKPLTRTGKLEVFADTDIKPDMHWRTEIRNAIEGCDIAILLVSADFLASDFINDHELPGLFKGRKADKKTLLTLFVSPCSHQFFPDIADYQALNAPDEPLSAMPFNEAEHLYAELTNEIFSILSKSTAAEGTSSKLKYEDFFDFPELEYSRLGGQRLISRRRVNLLKLIAMLEEPNLFGFSFEECELRGPVVLFSPSVHISETLFNTPSKDMASLTLKPMGAFILGAVPASHLNIRRCIMTEVAFVDAESEMMRALTGTTTPLENLGFK